MANFAFCKGLPMSRDFTWSGVQRLCAFQSTNHVFRRSAPVQALSLQRVQCWCSWSLRDVPVCRNSRIGRNRGNRRGGRNGRNCGYVSNGVHQLKFGGLGDVYENASAAGLLLLPLCRGKSRGTLIPCEGARKGHESGGVFVVVSHDKIERRRQDRPQERCSKAKELRTKKEHATEGFVEDQLNADKKGTIVDQSAKEGRLRKRGIYDFPPPPVPGLTMLEEGSAETQPREKIWDFLLDPKRMFAPRTRGIILLNVLTFLYGSNVSVIKAAGAVMDPTLFSVGRFAIASIAFTPFLRRSLTDRGLRKAGLELGLLASGGYLTQSVSLLTTDAARVSFISAFTVIVVPLFASLSGAKIRRTTWMSAAAGLVGVGMLEANGAPFAIGDVWSFASAIIFGVHISRTEHHSATLSRDDSLPVMALQLLVITVCAVLWSSTTVLSSGDASLHFQKLDWTTVWSRAANLPWTAMLYTGLVSTALCLWIELVSLRDVNASEAAVIYTTEPLWGATFAWVSLGERWGLNGWLGAFFIIGGSLSMQLFGHSDSTHSSSADPEAFTETSVRLNLPSDQFDADGDCPSGQDFKRVEMRDATAEAESEILRSK